MKCNAMNKRKETCDSFHIYLFRNNLVDGVSLLGFLTSFLDLFSEYLHLILFMDTVPLRTLTKNLRESQITLLSE